MKRWKLALTLACSFCFALITSADVVRLTNGKEIEGRVLHENDAEVVVETGKRRRTYARAEVASISSIERSLAELVARSEAVDRRSTDALAELASWCEESGLSHEAQNLWLRVLSLDPARADAYEGLGGREAGGGWQLRAGKKWLGWDELVERSAR
jgi:hypothetical protein